jgi:hypothetical protein
MLRVGFTDCPYCHRADIHISRAKSFGEELLILLLLRPVRCRDCMRRFFLPLFGRALPGRPLTRVTRHFAPSRAKRSPARSP